MRRAFFISLVAVVAAGLLPLGANAQVPPTPPRDQWFAYNDDSHWGNDKTHVRIDKACLDLPSSKQLMCSMKAFLAKPFVVIAFVDTGINPYHMDFRPPSSSTIPRSTSRATRKTPRPSGLLSTLPTSGVTRPRAKPTKPSGCR